MTRNRPLGLLAAAVVVPLVAPAAAGCGSNGGTSTATAKAAGGSSAKHVLRRMRHGMAPAARERQADGRQRREGLATRHDSAV